MDPKKLFILILSLLVFLLVVPSMDQLVATAQVPPPHLPGAPDQSPLRGGVLLFVAALLFGAWLLRTRPTPGGR